MAEQRRDSKWFGEMERLVGEVAVNYCTNDFTISELASVLKDRAAPIGHKRRFRENTAEFINQTFIERSKVISDDARAYFAGLPDDEWAEWIKRMDLPRCFHLAKP